MAVSLRDELKFGMASGNFVVSRYRASSRDAMPLALRLPRPQSGLAMTRNWSVFVWKTDAFCCMRSFLRGVASCRFSNISFQKLLCFSERPTKFVIARRACAPDAAIFNGTRQNPGTQRGRPYIICGAYITRILSRRPGRCNPNMRKSAAAIGLITAAGFLSAGISNRNRGFFSLCSDDAACGWPCSRSGGCAHGSRQRSVRPPPAYASCRRTCQSADAARRPRARSAC